jgi:molybdenum cofactor cytidylyltransferase
MKFRRVPLEQARGHILGHNVTREGRRMLKKGRRIGDAELAQIAEAGADSVHVAELEPDDVDEDAAALRVARALARGGGLRERAAYGGRVSLLSACRGVWRVPSERLLELTLIEGVTLAAVPSFSAVSEGQTVATLKIIPFALPEARVARAEELAGRGLVRVDALEPRRVSVIVSGAEGRRRTLLETFRTPLEERLAALGVIHLDFDFVSLADAPEAALAAALGARLDAGAALVILVSETATMDSEDLAPQAIRLAGGEVAVVGAPVFPGNLLLLGYRGAAAILGAPGCVRSRGRNVVDLILPRLLTGERLGAREVAELGLGGMLAGSDEGGG